MAATWRPSARGASRRRSNTGLSLARPRLLPLLLYHVSLKRGPPRLVPSSGGGLVLPMLMWPRPDRAAPFDQVDPQPPPYAAGSAAVAPRERRRANYSQEFWIGIVAAVAVAQLLVALIRP
jgi:hypothetical protein